MSLIPLEMEVLSDITLLLGKEAVPIKACKSLLAKYSSVFLAMFYGQLAEKNDTIKLQDDDPAAFGVLLKYVYSGMLIVESFEVVLNCFCLANKYLMSKLVDDCECYILENYSHVKYILQIYEYFKIYNSKSVEKSLELCRTNAEEIFQTDSHLDVSIETLIDIYNEQTLLITNEIVLVNALAKYKNESEKRDIADPEYSRKIRIALSKIHLRSLDSKDFFNCQSIADLLVLSEILAIVASKNGIESIHRMPEDFSVQTQPRNVCTNSLHKAQRGQVKEGEIIIEQYSTSTMNLQFKHGTYRISGIVLGTVIEPIAQNCSLDLIVNFIEINNRTRLTSGRFSIENLTSFGKFCYFDKCVTINDSCQYQLNVTFLQDVKFSGKYNGDIASYCTPGIEADYINSILKGIIGWKE
jgi:hypothetical protein